MHHFDAEARASPFQKKDMRINFQMGRHIGWLDQLHPLVWDVGFSSASPLVVFVSWKLF
jgi:hypothetical protein